jgi:RHS repeat-associated protein
LYKAWGEIRTGSLNALATRYTFTGQAVEDSIGLMFYHARWYDPLLGRFISADTIVPGAYFPTDHDRYAYSRNSPLLFVDPSGHMPVDGPCGVNGGDCSRIGASAKWYNDLSYVSKRSPMNVYLPFIGNGSPDSSPFTNGTYWSVPPTYISPPFYDPSGNGYGSASTAIWVGAEPFQIDDAYGEAPPTHNPFDLLIRSFHLFSFLLQDGANANFVANQEPNVTLTLYYNFYNGQGAQVSGLWVENGSEEWLAMNFVKIDPEYYYPLSSGLNTQSVHPGSTESIPLGFPPVSNPNGVLNVTISFYGGSSWYFPSITVDYLNSVDGSPR